MPRSWLKGKLLSPSPPAEPMIASMKLDAIVQAIDTEIDRLVKVRALLTDGKNPLRRGLPRTTLPVAARKRRKVSAEGRARMAAAQKARWAKARRNSTSL